MSLHHFPHQAAGRWHAVYQVPGTETLSSVCDCVTERAAKSVCAEENKRQERMAREAAAAAIHPADRKIPAGFYTDDDAQ